MLGLIGVRKLVCRLPRGDCSDQHCGPERASCVGLLRIFEYYAYFISHGQGSACDGRVRPHGLAASAFKQSCPIYSRNEPHTIRKLFFAMMSSCPMKRRIRSVAMYVRYPAARGAVAYPIAAIQVDLQVSTQLRVLTTDRRSTAY